MEVNRLYAARQRREDDVVDLIDTNFHRCGFRFPAAPLATGFADYLAARSYDPDPKGAPGARHAIASYYQERGVAANPDQVIITASTSEAYRLLFTMLRTHGDSIALPWPTYPLFDHLAEHAGLETVHYRCEPETDFAVSSESVRRAVRNDTGALVLISPNNPTGRIASEETVRELLEICRDRGMVLICDEVFVEMSAKPVPRPAGHGDVGVPVFTLNGFSKLFASPDLKVAWILTTAADDWIDGLEVANDMYLNASSASQHLVPFMFSEGGAFQSAMRSEVELRRAALVSALSDCPGGRLIQPEAGIHALFRLDFGDDEDLAVGLVEEEGVFVHPGYLYGLEEEPHFVLSCLPPVARIEEGCRRLRGFLSRRSR